MRPSFLFSIQESVSSHACLAVVPKVSSVRLLKTGSISFEAEEMLASCSIIVDPDKFNPFLSLVSHTYNHKLLKIFKVFVILAKA